LVFFTVMKVEPYREYLAEREELLRHKWLLSERKGVDVGFEVALVDWALNHRSHWRELRNEVLSAKGGRSKG